MPSHNAKRFEELVLYIAERTQSDPDFGRTKLAKVLFYSDFDAHRTLGEAITGAQYQNWEHGPYPPRLESAQRLLSNAGRATIEDGGSDFDPKRIRPRPGHHADPGRVGISAEQLAIVDAWIARISGASARRIEHLSHAFPGYKMVRRNEEIPYNSSFLARSKPAESAARQAEQVARERGWLASDGQWQWESAV
jgi:hypothetical protein